MRFLVFALLILGFDVFAAGDGDHSSTPSIDLFYKAFNFSVLFGFIIWKMKKPLSQMFKSSAEEIEKHCKYAEEANRKAQTELDTYEQKLGAAKEEREQILLEAKQNSAKFALDYESEIREQIAKYKKDAENKIEHEKKELLRQLNANLVDEVIKKTKLAIGENKDYQSKATSKLLSGID